MGGNLSLLFLWLWHRPAAIALIQPLVWKRRKKKNNNLGYIYKGERETWSLEAAFWPLTPLASCSSTIGFLTRSIVTGGMMGEGNLNRDGLSTCILSHLPLVPLSPPALCVFPRYSRFLFSGKPILSYDHLLFEFVHWNFNSLLYISCAKYIILINDYKI